MDVDVTPTEGLILDVLMTRWRLGEQSWPIDRTLSKAVRALEGKGLVSYDSGPTANTFRVKLTGLGRQEVGARDYQSPHLREICAIRHERSRPVHPYGSAADNRQAGELNVLDIVIAILSNDRHLADKYRQDLARSARE